MHAVSRRSRDRLRSAVLHLATTANVADLTVSEICTAAGVTRDTFYRHASSPIALLADALGSELDELADSYKRSAPTGVVETIILEHVVARLAIYRGAMRPVLPAAIRDRLERLFARGLRQFSLAQPERLPARVREEPGLSIAIAYAASGAVGAIETWLRTTEGKAVEVTEAAEMIFASSPAWWTGPSDT